MHSLALGRTEGLSVTNALIVSKSLSLLNNYKAPLPRPAVKDTFSGDKNSRSQEVTKRCRYLGRPIAPSYTSPNAGGGGVAGSSPMSTAIHMEPK
jgi:hypothetical protein